MVFYSVIPTEVEESLTVYKINNERCLGPSRTGISLDITRALLGFQPTAIAENNGDNSESLFLRLDALAASPRLWGED
jgi:hypothetical protein